MKLGDPRFRDGLLDRLSYQRVREMNDGCRPSGVDDEPGAEQLVERISEGLSGSVERTSQHAHVNRCAGDGDERCSAAAQRM
jgi:hypothetical protein